MTKTSIIIGDWMISFENGKVKHLPCGLYCTAMRDDYPFHLATSGCSTEEDLRIPSIVMELSKAFRKK